MLPYTKGANLTVECGHAFHSVDIKGECVIAKDVFVMIHRVVMHDDLVALAKSVTLPLDVLSGGSAHGNKGRVVAQHFLDSSWNILGMINQMLQLIGIFHEQSQTMRDGRSCTLVPANHQQYKHPREHLIRDGLAVYLPFE